MSDSSGELGLTDAIKAMENLIQSCIQFKTQTPDFITVSVPSYVDTTGMGARELRGIDGVETQHPIDSIVNELSVLKGKLLQMYGAGMWDQSFNLLGDSDE